MNNNQKVIRKCNNSEFVKQEKYPYKTLYFYCAMQSFWPEMYALVCVLGTRNGQYERLL